MYKPSLACAWLRLSVQHSLAKASWLNIVCIEDCKPPLILHCHEDISYTSWSMISVHLQVSSVTLDHRLSFDEFPHHAAAVVCSQQPCSCQACIAEMMLVLRSLALKLLDGVQSAATAQQRC